MKWTPQNSFHSPISDTHSPTSEPGVDLRRDCVVNEQRLWPRSGTVSAEINASQSHHKDTIQLPGGSGFVVATDKPVSGGSWVDLVQNEIAKRLGQDGWLILGGVSSESLSNLTKLAQRGKLDAAALEAVRLEYLQGAA